MSATVKNLPEGYRIMPERDSSGFNRYSAFHGRECIEAECLEYDDAEKACHEHAQLRAVMSRLGSRKTSCKSASSRANLAKAQSARKANAIKRRIKNLNQWLHAYKMGWVPYDETEITKLQTELNQLTKA